MVAIVSEKIYLGSAKPGSGGSAPVIDTLNVTPSISAQVITAPSGIDGYSPVNVAAVTSSIDANITAGNIKKDVSILGVTGSYEGVAPSGTKNITTNGIHDVAGYANADVQVPTTAPASYLEKTKNSYGILINTNTMINLNGATNIGTFALSHAYFQITFPQNTNIDLSSLTMISGTNACESMFSSASGIKSVDLHNLVIIDGIQSCSEMFKESSVEAVNLSLLEEIKGSYSCSYMFQRTRLISVDLPSLKTIKTANVCRGMFSNCLSLTTAKLNSLNVLSAQISTSAGFAIFAGCTYLESVELGGLTASTFASLQNQIQYLFNTSTGSSAPNGCTVHFPSNFDPSDPNHTFDASTLTGYPTFGGDANYIHVAFDLPATE